MDSILSITGATWNKDLADPKHTDSMSGLSGCTTELIECLALRGATSISDAQRILSPSMDHLHAPDSMHGVDRAVTRIKLAVANHETVRIVTDYDVDGTTSSLILQATLRLLGLSVTYHIPNRKGEGYGFSCVAAQKAADDGVSLLITADIGVRDHASVELANKLGVDVIICDHHLPAGESVPSGAIVLCPPQDCCNYPNPSLAACGVSLKLAEALLIDHPKRELIIRSLMKLVAIGTVADVVDLMNPENRALVSLGLEQINETRNAPGLNALLEVSGATLGAVSAADIGFKIGPRINAAGRISSATTIVDLLSCKDHDKAREIAKEVEKLNLERRAIQDALLEEISGDLLGPDAPPIPNVIVISGDEQRGWHRGITGIVAARIRDKFNRPALVVSYNGDTAVGSMRSIPTMHSVHLLDSCSDLLQKYGGHPAAAGFSLSTDKISEFRERLNSKAEEMLDGEHSPPSHTADLKVTADRLNIELVDQLARLEPHGKGNPRPRLWVEGVKIASANTMKDVHLKLRLKGAKAEAIWWKGAEYEPQLLKADSVDLLGSLQVNTWGGRRRVQFIISDARLN
jgi:single-stranded-DNA-specific exonuclease